MQISCDSYSLQGFDDISTGFEWRRRHSTRIFTTRNDACLHSRRKCRENSHYSLGEYHTFDGLWLHRSQQIPNSIPTEQCKLQLQRMINQSPARNAENGNARIKTTDQLIRAKKAECFVYIFLSLSLPWRSPSLINGISGLIEMHRTAPSCLAECLAKGLPSGWDSITEGQFAAYSLGNEDEDDMCE